jgi:cleavage and polyadenylation specificity factor subunit 3
MAINLTFLGGSEEIGASSSYLYLNGTGIFFDAGLHPKKRDKDTFPKIELTEGKPTDILAVTHAHTDHIGAIPYLLKYHPHLKIFMTEATRDLAEIMLKDTAKLLKTEVALEFSSEILSLYKPEILKKIGMVMSGFKYDTPYKFTGRTGEAQISMSFHHSGHILGSASVLVESNGFSLLYTGDIKFSNQQVLKKAILPKRHVDTLIIESTNANNPDLPSWQSEKKRLGKYINEIVNDNGSVLIPCFALGKTQEVLKILQDLMIKGDIPHLPIYTGGLAHKISLYYDKYCYTVPMVHPGFEISDIPQEKIIRSELMKGKYLREPSIVVATSGMVNERTISYELAKRWMRTPNFGIAYVGYQDPDEPGYALLHSIKDKEFKFGKTKQVRKCRVDSFRFSSHASLEELIEFVGEIKPKYLFIVHGEQDSSENLAMMVQERYDDIRIILPEIGKSYGLIDKK